MQHASSRSVQLRLGRALSWGDAAPVSAPEPVAAKASAPALAWKLRPVLDAISASAGGGVAGQLLVYKVFLQVPPDLLKASGIDSVNAVGPDFVISDPRLRDAFVAAAREHAKLDVSSLSVA